MQRKRDLRLVDAIFKKFLYAYTNLLLMMDAILLHNFLTFEPKNYSPISLLLNFSKIFEKLMYKRLKIFFEKNLVLYEKHYGFRHKYSTQHALIDIVNNIQNNTEEKLF